VERGCRGCLPNFVQRHECSGIGVKRYEVYVKHS
jgi:hypothetical protein